LGTVFSKPLFSNHGCPKILFKEVLNNYLLQVNGSRLLRHAASLNFVSVVRHLLKQGVDPNIADDSGITAMSIAESFNFQESIEILKKYGGIGGTIPEWFRCF